MPKHVDEFVFAHVTSARDASVFGSVAKLGYRELFELDGVLCDNFNLPLNSRIMPSGHQLKHVYSNVSRAIPQIVSLGYAPAATFGGAYAVGEYPTGMYVPPRSRESRIPVLQQAVDRLRFGTLVTFAGGNLRATHLPMLIDATLEPNGTLSGHIARNNPQWQNADGPIPGIATFLGPNFYVTPAWYATKTQTGKVVPTWNYIAVEARGLVQFFHERDRLLRIVERLTAVQESLRENPWSISDAPAEYIDQMLGAIVGFEMPIEALEGAWKLGQQKSDADRAGVAAGVSATSEDPKLRALLPLLQP